ncbi:MAG: tRNA(fMet)-specific endonuclease VapC [Pseudomonadales bacterium]|nr:tRNA(fMet)-specific endonuclease VapC [Pseudomonadales bacterium]
MLRYMLDTDMSIFTIKRKPPQIKRLFNSHIGQLCISAVTYGELLCGAEKSQQKDRNTRDVEGFAVRLDVLDFDRHASQQFAQVKAELELSGMPIGPYDMMIAAHARSLGLVLVTNNVNEFSRVAGLRIENWLDT